MNIRIRISLNIQDGQVNPDATPQEIKAQFAPLVEKAIAAALPANMAVDTVKVTRANVAKPNAPVEE